MHPILKEWQINERESMSDTVHFNVSGMSCDGCSKRLKESLMEIPSVKSVQASHETGAVDVTFFKDGFSASTIQTVIEETGFDVVGDPVVTRQ